MTIYEVVHVYYCGDCGPHNESCGIYPTYAEAEALLKEIKEVKEFYEYNDDEYYTIWERELGSMEYWVRITLEEVHND